MYFAIKPYDEIPQDLLNEMYSLRYKIAVEEWGWSIPTAHSGKDKDQFDTTHTIYFLVFNNTDNLVACSRLNPTTQPHLLSEIFPEHCSFSGVPVDENIWELSRFIVDKSRLSHFEQVQLYLQMCLAVTKYADGKGIKQVTWLSHKTRYTKSIVVWRTRPLGLPKHYPDDDQGYIAAIMDTDREAIERLKRFVKTDWSEHLKKLPSKTHEEAA